MYTYIESHHYGHIDNITIGRRNDIGVDPLTGVGRTRFTWMIPLEKVVEGLKSSNKSPYLKALEMALECDEVAMDNKSFWYIWSGLSQK